MTSWTNPQQGICKIYHVLQACKYRMKASPRYHRRRNGEDYDNDHHIIIYLHAFQFSVSTTVRLIQDQIDNVYILLGLTMKYLVDYRFLSQQFPMNYDLKYSRNMSGKYASDFSLISSAQPNTTDPRAPNPSPLNLTNMGVDQLSDLRTLLIIQN